MNDASGTETVHVETEKKIDKTNLAKMNTAKPRLHPTNSYSQLSYREQDREGFRQNLKIN